MIAVILVAGKLALDEVRTLKSASADLVTLSHSDTALSEYARSASAATNQRVTGYRGASIGALDARIADVRAALRSGLLAVGKPILTFPLPSQADMAERVTDHFKRQVEIDLLQQELAFLLQMRARASAGQMSRLQEVEQLSQAHVKVYARYLANKQELRKMQWPAHRRTLDTEHKQLLQDNMRAYTQHQASLRALSASGTSWDGQGFGVDQARLAAVVAPLREAHAKAQSAVTGNWISRLSKPVIDMLPVAGLVLLASLVGHFAIKAFLYYVLAPLATRHAPICLDQRDSGRIALRHASPAAPGPDTVTSAVSQSVTLAFDEQLLILPDYIQSSPMASEKTTRWLLDWSCPWTSLISGMWGLTCIRRSESGPIVVSAGEDPLSEIALLTLPAGAAMVFQPRCLVGVIYQAATPLRITRQWRLGSAHAWLTLQLRYLVFHGPATLIVKGTRGVRVEPAGQGRLISQLATLGFSASVDYSTVRCETFYPFYQGKTSLLLDRFESRPGYYVYDETPRGGKKSNFVARGLEGMSDAALKVLGI